MDNLEFRRRIIEQWNINPDEWEGWDFGYSGKTTSPYGFRASLSPFFTISTSKVTFYCGSGGNRVSLITYNTNKVENDYWTYTGGAKTITVKSGTVYGRLICNMDDLANYYVKDSNGNYLFNGADYI